MSVVPEHDEIRELLGAYAVNAIDDDAEREAIERHLETCAECRVEVDDHLEALATLTGDDDAVAGDEVWRDLRARIAEAPQLAPVVPLRRRYRGLALGAAAVAASVLMTAWIVSSDSSGTPTQSAEVVPAAQEASVGGTVDVFSPESPGGRITLELHGVPEAPAGHHYEVWVLRPGAGVEMEPIGAFTPIDGRASLDLPLPGPGIYVAVDISVQEDGGSPVHSGTSLAGAKLA